MTYRKHIFDDILTYACLFDECSAARIIFEDRDAMMSHLEQRHSLDVAISSVSCPLCCDYTSDSRGALSIQIARHMEEIALAILPPGVDPDEESTSETTSEAESQGEIETSLDYGPPGEVAGGDDPSVYEPADVPAGDAESVSIGSLEKYFQRPYGDEIPNKQLSQDVWQCTFGNLRLAPKSWRCHEQTQHCPKDTWTYLATGPRLTTHGATSICAFCSLENPLDEHFQDTHRIVECSRKSEADRTFLRPDHLRQHVKNFHKASLQDIVRDRWRKSREAEETWTCGFCMAKLTTWDMRATHMADHFMDGMTMASWSADQPPSD